MGTVLYFFPVMFPSRDSGGEFLPFLAVSKGKRLFARLLPFLKHHKALTILRVVTTNLPTLMSRDAEEVAPCASVQSGMLSPPFSSVPWQIDTGKRAAQCSFISMLNILQ